MKIIAYLTALILLTQIASAVVIHQVYYDPINERGSEAIEIYNDQNETIDISNWQIQTPSYTADATIPENTQLNPFQFFLIADNNWSNAKDNADWPDADHEESITIKNTDSGIILRDHNNTIIDIVGWGQSPAGFAQGSPAQKTTQGFSLLRIDNTKNNSVDFVDSVPDFTGSNGAFISIEVEKNDSATINNITLPDDSFDDGIQLEPLAGKIRHVLIRAEIKGATPELQFNNNSFAMEEMNGLWEGTIQVPYHLAPDTYIINIIAGETTQSIEFEYLPIKAWDAFPTHLQLKAAAGETIKENLRIKNLGNIPVTIKASASILQNHNGTLTANVNAAVESLKPGEEASGTIKINIPKDAHKGRYTGVIRFTEE